MTSCVSTRGVWLCGEGITNTHIQNSTKTTYQKLKLRNLVFLKIFANVEKAGKVV